MSARLALIVAVPVVLLMAGCGDSGAAPATAPATQSSSAEERIKQDLSKAGQEIHDVTTQAAQEAKPAIDHATAEGRQMIHDAAVKIAEKTATEPAPATAPQ